MKQIFTINMLFSFLFGALTAILPLSILMTGAASGMSGNVIGIFMIALFVTRIILMFLNPSKKILLLGCLLFLIGILLWLFFYHVLFVYFLVGIILGISVGVIPPLLIVFALGLKKKRQEKVYRGSTFHRPRVLHLLLYLPKWFLNSLALCFYCRFS